MMQDLMRFAKNTNGEDAKEQIRKLLSDGKMSKAQFENLRSQAEFISKMIKK